MSKMEKDKSSSFDLAVLEARDLWSSPFAKEARSLFWDTGDMPEAGFGASVINHIKTKYGLSSEDALTASSYGVLGASPEMHLRATHILEGVRKEMNE